ncbi:MAG: hypothetical protein IT181_16765 [Acidobacteria bacterium]|nr:hypothetical protein [Acidobacteriota bacterium]
MTAFDVFIGTWNTTGAVRKTDANPAGPRARWKHRLTAFGARRHLTTRQLV